MSSTWKRKVRTWNAMNDYFKELDQIFDRREEKTDTEAAALHKLERIRLIVEDKCTASNHKIEQIREELNK